MSAKEENPATENNPDFSEHPIHFALSMLVPSSRLLNEVSIQPCLAAVVRAARKILVGKDPVKRRS